MLPNDDKPLSGKVIIEFQVNYNPEYFDYISLTNNHPVQKKGDELTID